MLNVSASARGAERSSAQAATKEKNSQPWPALAVAVEVGQRFVAELIKVSAVDRGADVVQQLHEEMLVMDRGQRKPVELAGAQQVVDVRARIMLASVAVAPFLQRPEIELVLGALDVVPAGARVDRAVAGAARGVP